MSYQFYIVRLFGALIVALNFYTNITAQKVVHFSNSGNNTVTILCPELDSCLKFMQITDSHISVIDKKESDMIQYSGLQHKAYIMPKRFFSQDYTVNEEIKKSTLQYFEDALQRAKDEDVELLILTGDIVNFPSPASVKYVIDKLQITDIPWLYIAGNHDWCYTGMEGIPDSLRNTWIDRSLLPFYNGSNPLFYSKIIRGINFIGIDNSTGNVNEEQVEFLKGQLKMDYPIILFSHIPYDFIETNEHPKMTEFVKTISSNNDKIIAIIAGHAHQSSLYFTGNMCQYVSYATANGANFIYNVVPHSLKK